MKISKFFSGLFALVGICVALSALWLSVHAMDAVPAIIEAPESALEQVESMMARFCDGDYTGASAYLYGKPSLGVDREAEDEVGALIWQAFAQSMSYELVGECYATNEGLAQNIQVTTLDVTAVTDYIEEHARVNIENRARAAEDYDTVFDENDEYREEFIQEVLRDTTQQALDQVDTQVTTEVALHLVWSDGQWWVVSNDSLVKAISGGIAK